MRRVYLGFAVVVLLALPLLASAQDAKTVKGTVTTVAANSITVNVAGKDMTFAVEPTTKVTAPGAGTAARAAQKEGAAAPTLTALLKAGDNVEVSYRESGGAMQATSIRKVATTGSANPEKIARGVVTAVSNESLTVKGADGEWTFAIDSKTLAQGTGAGTMARGMKAAGEPTLLTHFVAVDDTVVVRYHESGATKQASSVRVMQKAKK